MNGQKFNQAVFERDDEKKKTGNHIRTHMNFGRTLTRYSLRIFVFHFSFPFSIETVNENAPVSLLKML